MNRYPLLSLLWSLALICTWGEGRGRERGEKGWNEVKNEGGGDGMRGCQKGEREVRVGGEQCMVDAAVVVGNCTRLL